MSALERAAAVVLPGPGSVAPASVDRHHRAVAAVTADYVPAAEALRLLGGTPATLYTYVSRGWVARVRARGGRGNLYLRADLMRLKTRHDARAGHAAVAAGALRWGEPVIDSAITCVRDGELFYRGHRALELARRGLRYEQVAELLWSGELPDRAPDWPVPRKPPQAARVRVALREGAGPVRALLCAVALLRARSPRIDGEGEVSEIDRARAVIRWLATGPGWAEGRRGRSASNPAGVAERCAQALGVRGADAVGAIELALIAIADHELNPSTFAARVTASAGSDLYACLASGLAALSGPRHGGATLRIEALLAESRGARNATGFVRARLARGAPLPGFGHPLYPNGDPRARALIDRALELRAEHHARPRALCAIQRAAQDAGVPPPNVDFGLVLLAETLGLRPSAALFVFAIGRLAGWVAHVLEQRTQGEQLRPRARYVGIVPP